VPGNERSGQKPLGQAVFADRLLDHFRRSADWMRARGLDAEGEDIIEESHTIVTEREMLRSKTAIAIALLKDVEVTDYCMSLGRQHEKAYGPLLRLVGAA
jgi:hypothetical protein